MLPDSLVEEVKREVDISSCLDDCSDRVTDVNDVVGAHTRTHLSQVV